jgi:hypothetical protein
VQSGVLLLAEQPQLCVQELCRTNCVSLWGVHRFRPQVSRWGTNSRRQQHETAGPLLALFVISQAPDLVCQPFRQHQSVNVGVSQPLTGLSSNLVRTTCVQAKGGRAFGTVYYVSGEQYKGEWRDNKRHGRCQQTTRAHTATAAPAASTPYGHQPLQTQQLANSTGISSGSSKAAASQTTRTSATTAAAAAMKPQGHQQPQQQQLHIGPALTSAPSPCRQLAKAAPVHEAVTVSSCCFCRLELS